MRLVAGRIERAHGVRGLVRVEVRTDDPDRRFAPGARLLTEPDRGEVVVASAAPHGGRLLVGFAGVTGREAAEALRGTLLVVDVPDDAVPDDPEEFWDHQLTGLTVVRTDGTAVGTVADVLHLPGQDCLAVRRGDGSEVLVPFVAAIVPTVDVAGGRLVVDLPPGLVDEGGP